MPKAPAMFAGAFFPVEAASPVYGQGRSSPLLVM
jgi:hypothetical protein